MENNTQNVNIEVKETETVAENVTETVAENVTETVAENVAEVTTEEVVAESNTANPTNTIVGFLQDFLEKAKAFISDISQKFSTDAKGMTIKLVAIALSAIIVIVGLSVGISLSTNNYKTPINIMEKYDNKKSYYNYLDEQLDLRNGFCKKEVSELFKLMKDSEEYEDSIEDDKDDFKDKIQDLKDEYGNNYKFTYKIIDKEKLDKEDLKDYRDELRDNADSLADEIEDTEEFDSDDWEDFADELGFDDNKAKAKKYISFLKDIRKVYKSAKVTAGYALTVEVKITGNNLDEPEITEINIDVIKVNNRWIPSSII